MKKNAKMYHTFSRWEESVNFKNRCLVWINKIVILPLPSHLIAIKILFNNEIFRIFFFQIFRILVERLRIKFWWSIFDVVLGKLYLNLGLGRTIMYQNRTVSIFILLMKKIIAIIILYSLFVLDFLWLYWKECLVPLKTTYL